MWAGSLGCYHWFITSGTTKMPICLQSRKQTFEACSNNIKRPARQQNIGHFVTSLMKTPRNTHECHDETQRDAYCALVVLGKQSSCKTFYFWSLLVIELPVIDCTISSDAAAQNNIRLESKWDIPRYIKSWQGQADPCPQRFTDQHIRTSSTKVWLRVAVVQARFLWVAVLWLLTHNPCVAGDWS